MSDLAIGSTIWYRDENRRQYVGGRPTERGHWVECKIVGETSRSWIVDYWNKKIPKKLPFPNGWASSEADMLRRAWIRSNSHAIGDAVRRLGWGIECESPETFEKLKAIAAVLGYKPEPP